MINNILFNDNKLIGIIPINPKTNEIFEKIEDGVILAKLINYSNPGTIDERVIIKENNMTLEQKKSNINLIINSAKSIGCLTEISINDILNKNKPKIIDFLFEIMTKIVLERVSINYYPQLLRLKEEKEKTEELLALRPEDFLKRWFNFHLYKAGYIQNLINFNDDIKDSQKYIILLNQLSPKCNKNALEIFDLNERAKKVLEDAQNIGVKVYINKEDIINGNEHLNILFIAEIFLSNNGINETQKERMIANKLVEDEGLREEKSFRFWMNSLKIKGVKIINNLYEESRSGIILLKVIDKIKPGTVDWKKVELKTKNPFKIGVNCQEVIDSSKRSGFSIISIGNKDIQEGKKKHILAIVWQLMKAYTLQRIGEKTEEELINWSNSKVSENRRIKSLKEKKLNDGLFWIELLASINPKCIRWDLISKENITDKDREMNAKYILSVSRSLGACNFVVWEDITEVKSKLLLTLLASIYYVAQFQEKNK